MSDVSAIVPTVAGGARLERLLASLAQDASSMQLIVIDNGAPDAPSVAGLEGRFADAQVIAPGQNLGYGRAVNLGARRAEGARIVTVNDDCECRSGFVEALAGAIDPGAGTVMAAGVMLDAFRPSLIETAGIEVDRTLMAFDYLNGLPVDPTLAGAEPPFGPSGAAAAYDREAFLAAGGFDEAIFAYLEDVDLALRLRLAGGSCALAVGARGTHGHSSTLGSGSAAKNELMGFGRGYLLRKWGSSVRCVWQGSSFARSRSVPARPQSTGTWRACAGAYGAGGRGRGSPAPIRARSSSARPREGWSGR